MLNKYYKTGNDVKDQAIDILLKVKARITDHSDVMWTSYDSPAEIRNDIERIINELQKGNWEKITDAYVHFLPASTFQEHSLQNGWTEEYIKLSKKFDNVYANFKNLKST